MKTFIGVLATVALGVGIVGSMFAGMALFIRLVEAVRYTNF